MNCWKWCSHIHKEYLPLVPASTSFGCDLNAASMPQGWTCLLLYPCFSSHWGWEWHSPQPHCQRSASLKSLILCLPDFSSLNTQDPDHTSHLWFGEQTLQWVPLSCLSISILFNQNIHVIFLYNPYVSIFHFYIYLSLPCVCSWGVMEMQTRIW